MSQCPARVGLDRVAEALDATPELLLRAPVPVVAPAQVGLPGPGIDGALLEAGPILRRQGDLHLAGDALGHVALQGQHVAEVALVALGPQQLLRGAVHELRVDADPLADAQDRSRHDRADAQVPGHLAWGLGGAAVAHHRVAGDHAQAADAGQAGDHRLGHAVCEPGLRGFAGQIVERQDGDGVEQAARRARGPDRLRGAQPVAQRGQLAAHLAGGGVASGRILRETAPDDALELGRQGGIDGSQGARFVAQDRRHDLGELVPGNGLAPVAAS